MISPELFINSLVQNELNFFTGVPDSLLKHICAYITDHIASNSHIVAANEGAAIGLAVGYHLATNKIPVVYILHSILSIQRDLYFGLLLSCHSFLCNN